MSPIILGKIQGVFGLQGWLKIYSWTQPKENIFNYSSWNLEFDDENSSQTPALRLSLEKGKPHRNGLIAKFEGIDTATDAQNLVGAYIKVEKHLLPQLPEGEFYWNDLIGLEVINQDGLVFGKVKNLLETGANDCIIVEPSLNSYDNQERILPYLQPEVITDINLVDKKIHVIWDKDF